MSAEIAPEVVQAWPRIERLLRAMAADDPLPRMNSDYREAAAIVALLPEPVDPDLVEAREVVKANLNPADHARCHCRANIDAGEWDSGGKVRTALAAIKRGRELERGQ